MDVEGGCSDEGVLSGGENREEYQRRECLEGSLGM